MRGAVVAVIVAAVTGSTAGRAALAVVLVVTSWHTAWNLGGAVGAVAYALAVPVATVLLLPWLVERLRRAPPAVVPAMALGAVAVLVAAFVLGVPASHADALGVGSDRADALGVALARLADGRYPYTATTYLGNPITPLPGALLLAAPAWWVTGSAATQNVLWLPLLLVVLNGGPRPLPRPTLLWVLAALGGLEVLREFLVGDDLVTGAVPALAAAAWALRAARTGSSATLVAGGVALGVTTCTRPHLALVLVVVVTAVGLRAGWRRAALVGGCAAGTWAVLVVPFLLGGTARFSPLHVVAKVTGDRSVTAGIVLVALLAAAVVLAVLWRVRPSSPAGVGWAAAAILFAPSLLSWVRGVTAGAPSEIDLTLGAAAVPFALWAVAADAATDPPVARRRSRRTPSADGPEVLGATTTGRPPRPG